jgi:acyl-CoA thioester hydrolase
MRTLETIPAHAFSMALTAGPDHIDELGHVNNAVWVQWIQSVATSHWAARATAEEQVAYIWVVVRHEIDYLRALTVGQSVTAYSWVPDVAKGAKFDRHMVFIGADGKPCVTALTTWALIDRASGRPMRVPATLIERFS